MLGGGAWCRGGASGRAASDFELGRRGSVRGFALAWLTGVRGRQWEWDWEFGTTETLAVWQDNCGRTETNAYSVCPIFIVVVAVL